MSRPTPLAVALLDRDGTINRSPRAPERYVRRPADVELLSGAAGAIASLNRAGVTVVVITNQRGVATGAMSESELAAVHRRLQELLAADGARVDRIYHCPHDEGSCRCRKPAPGMVYQALADLVLAPDDAVVVGDAVSDVGCAVAAGVRAVHIAPAADADPRASFSAGSLAEAVERLLA